MNSSQESQTESTRFGGGRGGNIIEFYAQEFRPEPTAADIFRQHVIQWFFAAKHLRYFEVSRLSKNATDADLSTHRIVCAALITFGEFASNFVRTGKGPGADLTVVGLSVESIEAETRLLRNNFKMFHDNLMSLEEAETILSEAFNEA